MIIVAAFWFWLAGGLDASDANVLIAMLVFFHHNCTRSISDCAINQQLFPITYVCDSPSSQCVYT